MISSTGLPQDEVVLVDDAWNRFERAIDQVIKSPPQHRTKPKAAKPKAKRKTAKGLKFLPKIFDNHIADQCGNDGNDKVGGCENVRKSKE